MFSAETGLSETLLGPAQTLQHDKYTSCLTSSSSSAVSAWMERLFTPTARTATKSKTILILDGDFQPQSQDGHINLLDLAPVLTGGYCPQCGPWVHCTPAAQCTTVQFSSLHYSSLSTLCTVQCTPVGSCITVQYTVQYCTAQIALCVTCHMSHVTCHVSHVTFFSLFSSSFFKRWSYSLEGRLLTGQKKQEI